ncbi:MAG: hypothetical protein HFACDABA_01661 [Anaerolineales bacterium]|nr:hypothetical protein [Anaerolineales bacterium]
MTQPVCLNCGTTNEQAPLLTLTFKGETQYLCSRCFPILIHKPQQLSEKLPGFHPAPPAPHEH